MATAADLRLVMMGTGTFAEPTFQALLNAKMNVVGLVTQPDRGRIDKRGSTRQTGAGMANIAESHGVAVYQPESINTADGVAKLQEWTPDLLVVAAYGQILSNDVLATAKSGGINVHASLLPKYRGAAPIAWAIWNGEQQSGVTIIRMSLQLDGGDMLAIEAVDILPDETAGELEARIAPIGAKLAVQVIEQIAGGSTKGEKQDPSQVTKAPKLKKHMGLIDWHQPSERVCNQIRAMQPWPTPYTFLHAKGGKPLRVIITKAVARDGKSANTPGHIIEHEEMSNCLFVAAGEESIVEALEIQPAGKRRMAAVEFLRGHRLSANDYFGAE